MVFFVNFVHFIKICYSGGRLLFIKVNINMRLAIEISPEEHRKIKALASYKGQSIKDFVLSQIFPKRKKKKEEKCHYGYKDHNPNKETIEAIQSSETEWSDSAEELFASWDKELAEK